MRTRYRRMPSTRPIAPAPIPRTSPHSPPTLSRASRLTMLRSEFRPWRWYGVLLLLLGQFAAGAAAQQPQSANAPLYTQDDLMFLTMMIMHHQQALDMAALVPSRSNREEFIRFARYVDGGQRAEIDQMQALLKAAAERGLEAPHHDMTGDPPMSGMLSRAQMAALAAAKGAEFERLWLQGMIYHHQGALDMAREQQERQFAS